MGKVDCGRRKCVALTFDDGPMGATSRLLGILERRRVRVTFFLVGRNAASHPEIVRRTAAGGHELANHSDTHTDLGAASSRKVRDELARTQRAIRQATGTTPTLMRPPYGSTDGTVAAAAKREGLAQILWSVDPLDWQVRDARTVAQRVVRRTRPGDIVLLHDIHPTTVAATPVIIDRLAANGYTFVTVTELFGHRPQPGRRYNSR
nr:polysaccharide deacetylase family protein [Actinomadura flavalba]